MNIAEIIKKGESKVIEFKESMPENSKIMKTAVAFSNGAGGKLIIGIKDKTNEVIGVSRDDVLNLPDKISNIIYDACYPNIIPEIYVEDLNNKSVIVVEFFPGNLKPYYIKSKGKMKGTYIRVGATNKQADAEMINELERQNRNISYDEEIMYDYENLNKINIDNFMKSLSELTDRKITEVQLESLKLLKIENGKKYPTRGLLLLIGNNNDLEYARIRCARFKGNDIDEFIDQKQFDGMLFEQVNNAMNFAKTYIAKRGIINDIKREDKYAIPLTAIREAIINAVVHRDYSITGSDIKFAIFDNRVEITSPGTLPKSLTIDDIKTGKSEIRNKVIARVFNEINYIEQWGTGIKRIINECKNQGLKEPAFEETGLFFKVTIFSIEDKKKKVPIDTDKTPIDTDKTPIEYNDLSADETKIIEYLRLNEFITNSIARQLLNKKETAVKELFKKLTRKNIIKAVGERRYRKYRLTVKQ